MSLFTIQKVKPVEPEKNSATVMAIYEHLKEHNGNISAVFSGGYGYPMPWIKWVYKESKRIERELLLIVRNNKGITITQAANLLTSEYLTIQTVGLDIIHCNPFYKADRTFIQFRNIYYVAPLETEE